MSSKQTILDDNVIYEFKPDMDPIGTVSPGERFIIHTRDSLSGEVESESDLIHDIKEGRESTINPATGPVFVEDSDEGDILSISIEEIQLNDDKAKVVTVPGFGLQANSDLIDPPRTVITSVSEDSLDYRSIEIKIEPMIGTIGVAPKRESYKNILAHDHGGNMDTKLIRSGSTIHFPVFQEGALFALGDTKAVMGDGELAGSGAEISTKIELKVDVEKQSGVKISRPVIETKESWHFLATADTLMEACQLANQDLVAAIADEHDLDNTESYMLSSLISDLEICQVVNPAVTIRNSVSKNYLSEPF